MVVSKKHQNDPQDNDSTADSCDDEKTASSTADKCMHIKCSIELNRIRRIINKDKDGGLKDECSECIKENATASQISSTTTESSSGQTLLDNDAKVKFASTADNDSYFEYDKTLWLCLFCGSQLCGRSRNRHALLHFETPRSDSHALALNTTTLEIWCYRCDEEIKCPDGGYKLQQIVDFIKSKIESKRTKSSMKSSSSDSPILSTCGGGGTPTTCTTIAIINNNSSTSNCYSQPIPGSAKRVLMPPTTTINNTAEVAVADSLPAVRGLTNLGNTCFFNAVLQCLAQTPFLLEVLKDASTSEEEFVLRGGKITVDGKEVELEPINGKLEGLKGGISTALINTLEELQKGGFVFSPSKLLDKFTEQNQQFRGYDQHDSHECLRHLLESVRCEDLKRYRKAILDKFNCSKKSPDTVDEESKLKCKYYGNQASERVLRPEPVFRGFLVSTLECQECFHTSSCHESFLDLSLPVTIEKPQPPTRRRSSPETSPTTTPASMVLATTKTTTEASSSVAEVTNITGPLTKSQSKREKEKERKAKRAAKKSNKRTASTISNNQLTMTTTEQQQKQNSLVSGSSGISGSNEGDDTISTSDNCNLTHVKTKKDEDDEDDDDKNTSNNSRPSSSSSSSEEQSDADVEDNLVDDTVPKLIDNEAAAAGAIGDGVVQVNRNIPQLYGSQKQQQRQHYDTNGNNELPSPLNIEKRGDSPENPNKDSNDDENDSGIATSPANTTSIIEQEMKGGGHHRNIATNNLVLELGISDEGASRVMERSLSQGSSAGEVAAVVAAAATTPKAIIPPSMQLQKMSLDDDNATTTTATKTMANNYLMQNEIIAAKQKATKKKRDRTQSHSDWCTTIAPRYQCEQGECSIQSCLNNFTAVELMTGNNKVGCDECTKRKNGENGKKINTNATKQLLISSPPAVLILHLKRFQVGPRFMFRKLSIPVKFPMILDIAPFCASKIKLLPNVNRKQKQLLYSLYGVVEHSGGMYGGHYVAYVKVRPKLQENDQRWEFLPKGTKAELDQIDDQLAKLQEIQEKYEAKEKARQLRKPLNDSDDDSLSTSSSSSSSATATRTATTISNHYHQKQQDQHQPDETEGAIGGGGDGNDLNDLPIPLPPLPSQPNEPGPGPVPTAPPPGKWYYVSDSSVRQVDEETVLKAQAYLLFYERIY